jgi:zinc transport system permease protein
MSLPEPRGPISEALLAALAGALAVALGLAASLAWDTPAGPSIVVAAALLFFLSLTGGALVQRPGA